MIDLENDDINNIISNSQTFAGEALNNWRREIEKYDKYAAIKDRKKLLETFIRDLKGHIEEINETEQERNVYVAGLVHGIYLSSGATKNQ